jgi:hypothetical protein
MGGQSYSHVEIDADEGIARFTGKCAIVPSLQAPGFITLETGSHFTEKPAKFPDVSSCTAFALELRTNEAYTGYRFSFGKAHVPGGRFAFGYKTPLSLDADLPPVGEFGTVVLPFDRFSDKWDDATGDIIVECRDDPSYCPSAKWLARMETMSFWAEGVEGMVDLEIKSIAAIGCAPSASETAVPPPVLQARMHSFVSNPIYMIVVGMTAAVLACAMLMCCCCCRRRRRHHHQRHSHKNPHAPVPKSDVALTYQTSSSYTDNVSAVMDGFHDEPNDACNNSPF